ncbi:ParB/RepB/Spo0J family partition protein [Duganella phyllosphaerae]|uniref:Chromosome-partitioning protein Spo0J n=1 Tax=Duganella phyllosphaerae TaxID=762836 RepID=A0A1E7X775_9BURK|nr:ParB/RepB/Spo0J family partition protein [Duganella phyllosphaerae]OFA08802.1 chromosome-partitioning protein Spo0J [Duganella phyllosphaerae]
MSKAKSPARAAAAPPPPAAALLDQGTYGVYDLSDIRKSPTNRKRFNEVALQQLAANIKEMGVVQPILIRPVTPTTEQPEPYELVAGERRWRASGIAEVATIPAMCRTLSDKQAAEIQILENLQREDPHPLEEAEGYEQLMMNHGYNADQLADKIKKSRAYIYGRLKLCALTTEAREKFLTDEISASTALLVARIPVPALQVRALAEITATSHYQPEPMSYRSAQKHIQQRYTLDLNNANFDVDDAKLLAAAGSCAKCPKRSGNQPLIYEDIKSADVCTDPDCFSEKRAAHCAQVIVIANKTGVPVIDGEEARKIVLHGRGTEFVYENTSLFSFERNAPSTGNAGKAGDYLGKENMPKPARYLKDSSGNVTPIYDRAAVQAALEKVGACEKVAEHAARMAEIERADQAKGGTPPTAQQLMREKYEKMATRETDFRIALYRQLRQRGANGFSLESLRDFVKLMVRSNNDYAIPDDLIGDVYPFPDATDDAVCTYIDQASLPEVQLVLVDLVMGECLGVDAMDMDDLEYADQAPTWRVLTEMARHEGIDTEQERRKFELGNTPIDELPPEDFADLIRLSPERLADLTALVMADQPHNVSALQRAANANGYTWTQWQTPSPGSAWTKGDGSIVLLTEEITVQPAASADQAASVVTIEDGDYVDAGDFEQPAPETARRASKAKTQKAKPAAPALEPTTATDTITPPQTTKQVPVEAWPFPKSRN